MQFEAAIKRPFQDLEVLLIGSLIAAIPIVDFLFVGFVVECIRRSLKKDDSLPVWKLENFLDGIKFFGIGVIYAIPIIVALVALIGVRLFSSLATVVIIILAIPLGILATAGVLNFAKTGNFWAAFAVGELKSTAFSLRFVRLLVVASLVSFAATLGLAIPIIILSLIPVVGFIFLFIGRGFLTFIGGIIFWTIITEKYLDEYIRK